MIVKADYDRPAPGASTKFERAYKDAPPMIPHSVEGLIPITKMNNQCLGLSYARNCTFSGFYTNTSNTLYQL